MSTRTQKLLFWSATLILILACTPALATSLPTAGPNDISRFIVETANAAATQTARALPTSSPTATITPTRNTETPTPTYTATVIFILASPTQPVQPTIVVIPGSGGSGGSGGGGGGSSSSDNFACQVVSVSPANGTRFNKRADFDATWKVKNIGAKGWDRNSVDFVYLSGDKIHKVAGYDLSGSVASGNTVDLTVDMRAPNASGTYTTTWTLRVGDTNFCNMSLTIVVR